jgi:hypothetical protein
MRIIILISLISLMGQIPAQAAFSDYFSDETLRIDYFHIGDAESEAVTLDKSYLYKGWAGSLVHAVDELNYGSYYYKVYDSKSGELIWSRGFDSYFKEYQTSAPAIEGVSRTFHESALIPFPKKPFRFTLERRQKEGSMKEIFKAEMDPASVSIIRYEGPDPDVMVFQSLENGDPHLKADIAIIGEGYTREEEGKFREDLARFTKVFFEKEPCRSHKAYFNVYGVFKPSAESGVDEPTHGSFRQTAVSATFNSLGSERYLLTEDNKSLRDIAAHAPYDALYIMVNHDRYGGGGIYNLFCTFTTGNDWSEYLMVHEFGHSFFGLADEYYTSNVAYTDFYPAGFEPAEPNITALLDPENLKWKHLVEEGTPLPTPWEKEAYDEADLSWQKERAGRNTDIADMDRDDADPEALKEAEEAYNKVNRAHSEEMHRRLTEDTYFGRVGAFEGAGYASTGMYRPELDCIMFSKSAPDFCRVCKEAMVKVIKWYGE